MLGLQKHARPLTAITVATVVALAAFVPSIVSADRSTPAPSAAAKKKKKKKWPPLTATVNGSFTTRYDEPGGFGGDNGPKWQQLKVVIKNAKIPFRPPNRGSAGANLSVRLWYEDEAHTQDYSPWKVGCDSADYRTSGDWQGIARVTISNDSYSMRENGKPKAYRGWAVYIHPPVSGFYMVTSGSFQEWDSFLDNTCRLVDDSAPPGVRFPSLLSYGSTVGYGKLSSDGRSVRLTEINTEAGVASIVSGSIKFNTPVER